MEEQPVVEEQPAEPAFPFTWTEETQCFGSEVVPKVWDHNELKVDDKFGNKAEQVI